MDSPIQDVVSLRVLSVLLAVFVPLLRAQPPTFRRLLVWSILISATLAVAGLVVLCLRRWWIETRGGELLLHPKRSALWIEYLPCVIMAVVSISILVGTCVLFMPLLKEMPRLEQALGLPPVGLVTAISAFAPPMLALAYAITLLWWQVTPMTLEIRENGVGIGGLRFFPWSAIDSCQWRDGKHGAIMTLSCHAHNYVAVMPLNMRESVERLLDAKGIRSYID